jgi:hypothetical protein
MAISKRLRFEILRRDNHRCRYCGVSADQVKLVIDHVVPESLGGTKDPSNLVASCEPCNSGKTSTTPDAPVVEQVADDAIRWAAAMQRAAADMLAEHDAREAELDEFLEAWKRGRSFARLPDDWEATITRFRATGLPMPLIINSAIKAHANRKVSGPDVFRYMCGICWKLVTELQEAARAAVGGESKGEVLSAREQLAKQLFNLIHEHYPDIAAEATDTAYADLDEPADERSMAGEESIHVLATTSAILGLLGELTMLEVAITAGFRRLSVADQAEVEDRLAHDIRCAGYEEGQVTEIEYARHRMRHMLGLAVRDEA